MSTTPEATPAAPGAPEAPADGNPTPAVTPAAPAAPDDALSSEDARKLRSEAKNLRDRLKTAEDELKKRDDADLSTTQKLEREKNALEAEKSQLETRLRDANVQAIAAKVGVKTDLVDTVSALIDWDEVDAGDSKAIEKAVKELVKERPSLSARPDGLEGGRRTRQDGEGDMDSVIRRAAGRA